VISLTLAEVAAAVGGTLHDAPDPAARVDGPLVVDSREAGPGSLFVALPGERVDGHDYAAAAVVAGAAGVLAARPVGVPAVVVPDVVAALGRLARAVLDRLPLTGVVGLTGSSGKTSTKDLLAQLLAGSGPTVAAQGSYNNDIGLPLTVLRADATTRHLVLEMGARGPGHIARLCRVAPPRVGAVLNVGSAHLGEFGSREAIARSKQELVESLPAGGVAVLNADDDLVRAMAGATPARVITFGTAASADVRAVDVTLDPEGRPAFTLVARGGSAPVRLRGYGEHQVANALAAAAVATELGLPVPDVAVALGAAEPLSRWRMEVVHRADGVTVINDAYNANPESVRAALRALLAIAGGSRRSWAVLGEMRELGTAACDEHLAVGRLAARLGVSRLLAVGPGARAVQAGATDGAGAGDAAGAGKTSAPAGSRLAATAPLHVPDADAAIRLLRAEVRAGDVVLVKASRAAGLERVAAALLGEAAS